MKNFIRNHSFALPVTVLLAIGVSSSAFVWNATQTPEQEVVKTAPKEASTVQWSETPAAEAIRNTISNLPEDWKKRGGLLESVTAPYPLTCNPGDSKPSYSLSQQYSNGITVSLASYTAGAGAVAMQEQRANSAACVGGNTSIWNTELDGVGTEAFTIHAQRGSAKAQTTVFRQGDVIGFVLSNGGSSESAARTVSKALSGAMGGKCVNPDSTVDGASRSLWTGVEFTGLLTDTTVKIDEWSLPSVPSEADYEKTEIPAKVEAVDPVSMPVVPSYPVWPLLPKEQDVPNVPKAPAKEADTKTTVQTRIADPKGPGCGWEFTGTVAPVFDTEDIEQDNEAVITAAEQRLEEGAEKWSDSVLDYWKSVDKFQASVKDYKEYRTEVNKVKAKWEPIHKEWDKYYTAMANYDAAVEAREAFIADKEAAQNSYESSVAQCLADAEAAEKAAEEAAKRAAEEAKEKAEQEQREREERESKPTQTPDPKPTNEPDEKPTQRPTNTPTPEETAPPVEDGQEDAQGDEESKEKRSLELDRATFIVPMVNSADCDIDEPAILSQDAPELPDKPEKPENPVPEGKR